MMKMGQENGSTRHLIMTLLKTKGPLTIGALAEELGITEMGVRRHVLQLEQEGLAKTKVVRQAMGRPLHMYSLTEKSEEYFPKAITIWLWSFCVNWIMAVDWKLLIHCLRDAVAGCSPSMHR